MRDLNRAAEAGCELMNSRRDLKVEDMRMLLDEAKAGGKDGLFQSIRKAYNAGFMQGYEQRAAEDKKAMCRR